MFNYIFRINNSFSLKFEFGNLLLIVLFFLLLAFIIRFFGVRSWKSILLRFFQIILLLLVIYPPKIISSEKEILKKGEIFVIDSSRSMSEEAVSSCESFSKSKENIIYYFVDSLYSEKPSSELTNSKVTDIGKVFNELSLRYRDTTINLCTDGQDVLEHANEGLVELKKSRLKIKPIYVDANLLRNQELIVKNINSQIVVTQGEDLKISFGIENPTSSKSISKASLYLDDKIVNNINLDLGANENKLFDQTLSNLKPGRHKITVSLGENKSNLNRWIFVKENLKTLIISTSKEESNLLRRIFNVIQSDVDYVDIKNGELLPNSLELYSNIILNDVSKDSLNNNFLELLKKHVTENSRDLTILGGDTSFGLGKYQNTILEDLSPLSSVPPRSKIEKLPSAVIVVVDKSGSMAEQGKIMAAKLAALSTIESLKDSDYVGVIGFDQAPLSVIDINLVSEVKKDARYRLQANLDANGHTNLLPALALANLRLAEMKVGRKHIIVLTDGQIPQSNSEGFSNTINKIRQGGITVSTVALGYEADVAFLQYLAKSTKGSFYQTLDASRLPKIFIDDVKIAVGEDTIKEQSSYPVKGISGSFETLSQAPDLAGFVETKLKDGSRLEAEVYKGEEKFPLFASWKSMNGKVSALATDIQGRWSAPWLRWDDLANFVNKFAKDVEGKSSGGTKEIPKFDFRYSSEGREIKFEIFIYDTALLEKRKNQTGYITLSKMSGESSSTQVTLLEEKPGLFKGNGEINAAGDYLAKIKIGDFNFDELGLTINSEELGEKKGLGINYDLLNQIYLETNKEDIDSKELNAKLDNNIKIFPPNDELTKEVSIWIFLIACALTLVLEVVIRENKKRGL